MLVIDVNLQMVDVSSRNATSCTVNSYLLSIYT